MKPVDVGGRQATFQDGPLDGVTIRADVTPDTVWWFEFHEVDPVDFGPFDSDAIVARRETTIHEYVRTLNVHSGARYEYNGAPREISFAKDEGEDRTVDISNVEKYRQTTPGAPPRPPDQPTMADVDSWEQEQARRNR